MATTAYITVGTSASGKTTWARERLANAKPGTLVVVNRDDIRWDIMRDRGLIPSWSKWKWKWEKDVNEIVETQIRNAWLKGADLIISDTNLNPGRRAALIRKLRDEYGYEDVQLVHFYVSWEEAIRRDNSREHGVGYSVLATQFEQYHEQFDIPKPYSQNRGCEKVVLCDIDGTVADMKGIRGPFEWGKVDQDKPKTAVIQVVRSLMDSGIRVIFFSGRDGNSDCREKTLNWLRYHINPTIQDSQLVMRSEGDTRPDYIVKEEMYTMNIYPYYDVLVVIDDRPAVCRMWRRKGFEVMQIGNPYIEF